jgi:hypothetical protein
MPTVVYRGSRADVARVIRTVSDAISGRGPDPYGVARPVLTRGAVALLSKIQQAFIEKARGGTGSDGIRWKPLERATIAARRTTKAELRSLGVRGRRERGLLTPAENKQWKAVFARTLARLRARGLDDGAAMARAAQTAWAVLKAKGAKTKLQVLGGRTVEILRDTGELLQSLTPGFEESPAVPTGQILEVAPGRIAVGTRVKPWHHTGIPGKLPARPFWPPDGNLPAAWFDAVKLAMARGIVAALARHLSAAG